MDYLLNLLCSIVFVHGLTGHCEATWTCENIYWPQQLLPKRIPRARILAFGYDADVVNLWTNASQNRISDHAENLSSKLGNYRADTNTVRAFISLDTAAC